MSALDDLIHNLKQAQKSVEHLQAQKTALQLALDKAKTDLVACNKQFDEAKVQLATAKAALKGAI